MELKPCPFCGNEKTVIFGHADGYNWWVKCKQYK